MSSRPDGRTPAQLRPVTITTGFVPTADGSALIAVGETRVICTASVEESVPGWRRGSGKGWLTAEYGMLPASTGDRKPRDISRGKLDGRSSEIQRLIGRALRAVVDLEALGERTVWLDCDVLTADGGTRCAAICGAYVALELAVRGLVDGGLLAASPVREAVAAVSAGIVGGEPRLDLAYLEDSRADADANVVMTASGGVVEVQATAEGAVFPRAQLDAVIDLAVGGIAQLVDAQNVALGR
ncbi:MAG: ribonuclease PH [Thermoleophilia bacterium]|nr:ribonuclease PH [Thermoleophilia bacterium]